MSVIVNTSATGGYLSPSSSPSTEIQLEDVLHDALAGITGLAATKVRPRWQANPPKQPGHTVDWCAFGIQEDEPDQYSAVLHDGSAAEGEGTDTVISWESLVVLVSFYGPNAWNLAGRLRAGLAIEQNRAPLRAAGLALGEVGRRTKAPELVNNTWLERVDQPLLLRNESRRTYGVKNIVCGSVAIETDTGLFVQTTPMT